MNCSKCGRVVFIWGDLAKQLCIGCDEIDSKKYHESDDYNDPETFCNPINLCNEAEEPLSDYMESRHS